MIVFFLFLDSNILSNKKAPKTDSAFMNSINKFYLLLFLCSLGSLLDSPLDSPLDSFRGATMDLELSLGVSACVLLPLGATFSALLFLGESVSLLLFPLGETALLEFTLVLDKALF